VICKAGRTPGRHISIEYTDLVLVLVTWTVRDCLTVLCYLRYDDVVYAGAEGLSGMSAGGHLLAP